MCGGESSPHHYSPQTAYRLLAMLQQGDEKREHLLHDARECCEAILRLQSLQEETARVKFVPPLIVPRPVRRLCMLGRCVRVKILEQLLRQRLAHARSQDTWPATKPAIQHVVVVRVEVGVSQCEGVEL